MNYLISGVFIPRDVPITFSCSVFVGKIELQGRSGLEPTGEMYDYFGKSFLYDVSIGKLDLLFVKTYENRPRDNFYYHFKKRGEIWDGEYTLMLSGGGVDKGESRCILTPVDAEFFARKVSPLPA